MKTFEDLEFKPHPSGGEMAYIEFSNGYGVSVIFGSKFYSNGIDTYELAVMKDGDLCYSSGITNDVIGYITKDEVTEYMKQIQELED